MTESAQGDALQELLNWSARLHPWQRHGLRCLTKGALKNEDIADTLEGCRLQHGLPAGKSTFLTPPTQSPPTLVSLSKADLPCSAEVSAPVSLGKIEQVHDVNALADDQVLEFGPGLTVIYGDNASGKSGYARILKRACRAREREADLLTNVYGPPPNPDAKPRATIHYLLGAEPHQFAWVDGCPTAFELPFVQVFDSGCARVQVSEKNDIIFTPLALDLLQRLGDLCDMVKEQLLAEKAVVEAKVSKKLQRELAELEAQTEAGKAIAKLTHETNVSALRRLGTLTELETKRAAELRDILAQNPATLASEARNQRSRLDAVLRTASSAMQALSAETLTVVHRADSDYRAKSEAASLAASTLFSEQPLPGVGSDAWRTLWEAARAFSTTHAYTKQPFPRTTAGSRCVLCQQELGDDASKRLLAFEEFVRAETQRVADVAKAHLDRLVTALRNVELPTRTRELPAASHDPVARTVRRFLILARRRHRAAVRACESGWGAPLPELAEDPRDSVRTRLDELDARIDEIERSALSEERRKLEHELRELEDRTRLGQLVDELQEEIERLKLIQSIEDAIRSADTRGISRKSTEIAKSTVTNRLRDQFLRELQELGIHHARVELAQVGTTRGTPQFKAQLLAKPDATLQRILSEGEHTCVALAAFLAELAVGQHISALVFDDPVSSLDHNWRRRVAIRLAEEAKKRQVVVFTHDTVFLMALMESGSQPESSLTVVHLERKREVTGIVVEGAPWTTMRVKERVPYLRRKIEAARPFWDQGDSNIYEPLARDFYGLLREAWERGVEELLLNQVVLRFGRTVQTTRLRVVTDITDADVATVDAAMTKCSTFMRGHDDAPAINESVPVLPELESDLAGFESWIQDMRKRKRS